MTMPKTGLAWAMLACKSVALLCFSFALFAGRHPPALAQGTTTAADQRRDDSVVALQKGLDANAASIARLWDANNGLRADVTQMKIDAAAGRNYSTWLSGGGIAGILASIGLQVRPKRRRRSRQDEEDE